MIDSTNDLNFSDYAGGKVVGTHASVKNGNGLKNKEAKEIIIPEKSGNVHFMEQTLNQFLYQDILNQFFMQHFMRVNI